MAPESIIHVDKLCVQFGQKKAVDEISFEVLQGEIFGIIGPNGAGKTTTISCLEGILKPTSGDISILGMSPKKLIKTQSHRVGIQLQNAGMLPRLKVREIMELYAAFYKKHLDIATSIEQFGLSDEADNYYKNLSGGQKQRLFGALALLPDPEILFLDELTSGLDRTGRHKILDMVKYLKNLGKTVVFTTHYLDEAELLCDRIAIFNHGKILALDSTRALIRRFAGLDCIELLINGTARIEDMAALAGVKEVKQEEQRYLLFGEKMPMIKSIVKHVDEHRLELNDLRIREPTLNEVFDIVSLDEVTPG